MMNIIDLLKKKKGAASIFDVAKYILLKEENIDSLKLMKLCYYCQAWYLAWNNESLFEEDFRAWVSGPCCLELYNFTKGKELSEINFPGNADKLSKDQKESIDAVYEYFLEYDKLRIMCFSQSERPYKEARGNLKPWEPCDNIITKESMASYYGSL